MHPVLLIVFLPLLAAIIAGLGGRVIGKTASKVVTTGALMAGALLSWPIFFSYLGGNAEPVVVPVLKFIQSGALNVDWALRVDTLTAVMSASFILRAISCERPRPPVTIVAAMPRSRMACTNS